MKRPCTSGLSRTRQRPRCIHNINKATEDPTIGSRRHFCMHVYPLDDADALVVQHLGGPPLTTARPRRAVCVRDWVSCMQDAQRFTPRPPGPYVCPVSLSRLCHDICVRGQLCPRPNAVRILFNSTSVACVDAFVEYQLPH